MKKVCFLAVMLMLLGLALAEDGERDAAAAAAAAGENDANVKMDAYRQSYQPPRYEPFPTWWWEAIDMAIFGCLLAAGGIAIVKNQMAKWRPWLLGFALLYLGFWRGGCICALGSLTSAVQAFLRPETLTLAALVLFLLPLAIALYAGRVFCTSACPLGAWQQFLLAFSYRRRLPGAVNRALAFIPLVIFAYALWRAAVAEETFVCRVDPFLPFFKVGQVALRSILGMFGLAAAEQTFAVPFPAAAWGIFAIACGTSLLLALPFCRFICPYGALLGLFAMAALRQRRIRADRCTACGACERACPTQAIDGRRRLSLYACLQCDRCAEVCPSSAIETAKARR